MSASFRNLILANHMLCKKRLMGGLSHYQLSSGQPKVLDYLSIYEPCSQKELAENCYVEDATLSFLPIGMKKNGLIEQTRNPNDRRSNLIFLTDEGRRVVEAMKRECEKVDQIVFSDFSEEEKNTFLSYMERMRTNIEKCSNEK